MNFEVTLIECYMGRDGKFCGVTEQRLLIITF
jgi:hypothetical protein